VDVSSLAIADVKIFTPNRFADSRGYFTETYAKRKFDPHAPDLDFVQDNESYSRDAFTVRGLHYQAPPFAQDKLIRVIRGSIFDVAVDVRKSSPSFGRWVGATLTAANGKQLLAPKGFLHGFMTLEPDTLVAYKVTNYYDKASDGAVFWGSPELAIDWPVIDGRAILSEKDASAPRFSAFQSPF
jgi:dTDP-4-dehydrorhamnose 3,5-epimerase